MNRLLSFAGAFLALVLWSSLSLASVPKKVFGEEFGASW